MNISLLITTTSKKTDARRLAQAALGSRTAACVQILPATESLFVWKGRRKTAREFLVLAKTSVQGAKALERLWTRLHPYECPELVTLSGRTTTAYGRWIRKSTTT